MDYTTRHTLPIERAGWRVPEWAASVGISRALAYELLRAGRIRGVKLGAARIITTRPADFLAALAAENGSEAA
ncbi:MAG TPA: hypothetical protein VGF07_10010 [Stellaceae bacterium]|jgi:hypothetical protein